MSIFRDPALWVSLCALGFTLFSFWWIQARRGKVVAFEPPSFCAYVDREQRARIRLPVVLYNSGARSRVVRSVRLVVVVDDADVILRWVTFRTGLMPDTGDVEDLPSGYAVEGRSTDRHFIDFRGGFPGGVPEPVERTARIELLLDNAQTWQPAGTFPLRLWHWTEHDVFIAYSNAPEPCDDGEQEAARAAMLARATETPAWAATN